MKERKTQTYKLEELFRNSIKVYTKEIKETKLKSHMERDGKRTKGEYIKEYE